MGICGSSDMSPEQAAALKAEKARSAALERQLAKENQKDQRFHKLLLVGGAEAQRHHSHPSLPTRSLPAEVG